MDRPRQVGEKKTRKKLQRRNLNVKPHQLRERRESSTFSVHPQKLRVSVESRG